MNERGKQALVYTLADIGQLTAEDRRELERYVRKGWLSKGRGGPFPLAKTVYARPGFDFAADRQRHIDEMLEWHRMDVARGVVRR